MKAPFKTYSINQGLLFPSNLQDLIPEKHPVRIVNQIVESVDLTRLFKKYKGGGSSAYSPRMLLKVIVYGYLNNLYSSRKIEDSVKQNIYFMWLAGMQQPDHNTINRFRGDRLKGVLKTIFTQIVTMLAKSGQISLKDAYLDGTFIEANANRYTFVWGRSIKYNKNRIKDQLQELWSYAEQVTKEELANPPAELKNINSEVVEATIKQIDQALQGKEVSEKVKKKLTYAKKKWPKILKKYERQEKILGERNSYSKTDHDATFMRTKDKQLKPCYNLQMSTNGQYILHYTLHQKPVDSTTLPAHLADFKKQHGKLPSNLIADAGYGSEENYTLLEKENIKSYVKYSGYYQESKRKWHANNPCHPSKLAYNKKKDSYTCPKGHTIPLLYKFKQTTRTGYKQDISTYNIQGCSKCFPTPVHKRDKEQKIIRVNHRLNVLKAKSKANLLSEQGQMYCSKRCIDVESVFGIIKRNRQFRRFALRGLEKAGSRNGVGFLSTQS